MGASGAFSLSPFRIPCYLNKKRKKHLTVLLSFWRRARVFLLVFTVCHEGKNFLKTTDICATGGKRSTGAFSISPFRIPCYLNKKRKKHLSVLLPFWRRARDSPHAFACASFGDPRLTPSVPASRSALKTVHRTVFLRADPHGFESNKFSVKKKKMPIGTFFLFGGEQGIRTLEPF